jgi:hypothetical protein
MNGQWFLSQKVHQKKQGNLNANDEKNRKSSAKNLKSETRKETSKVSKSRRDFVEGGDSVDENMHNSSVNLNPSAAVQISADRDLNSSWRRTDEIHSEGSFTSYNSTASFDVDISNLVLDAGLPLHVSRPLGTLFQNKLVSIQRYWWYKDLEGIIQGPFASSQMQDWYNQGYLPSDLPVRSNELDPFVTLRELFSRGEKAFLDHLPVIAPIVPFIHTSSVEPVYASGFGLSKKWQSTEIDDYSVSRYVDHYDHATNSASLWDSKSSSLKSENVITELSKADGSWKEPFISNPTTPSVISHRDSFKNVDFIDDRKPVQAIAPEVTYDLLKNIIESEPSPEQFLTEKNVEKPIPSIPIENSSLYKKDDLHPTVALQNFEESHSSTTKMKKNVSQDIMETFSSKKESSADLIKDKITIKEVEKAESKESESFVKNAKENDKPQDEKPRKSSVSWAANAQPEVSRDQLSLKEIMQLEEEEEKKRKAEADAKKHTIAGRLAAKNKSTWATTAKPVAANSLADIMKEQQSSGIVKASSTAANDTSNYSLASLVSRTPVSTGKVGAWGAVPSVKPVDLRKLQETDSSKKLNSAPEVKSTEKPKLAVPSQSEHHASDSDSEAFFWDSVSTKKLHATLDIPKVSNEFGGPSMSAEFSQWCKTQLIKLTGSDDFTLVNFLLTLDSNESIRDYVKQYLGQSNQIDEFVDGFIRQKQFVANVCGEASNEFVDVAKKSKKKGKGKK